MSDQRLRELERRWKESGALADQEAWLQEAVRSGSVTARDAAEQLRSTRRVEAERLLPLSLADDDPEIAWATARSTTPGVQGQILVLTLERLAEDIPASRALLEELLRLELALAASDVEPLCRAAERADVRGLPGYVELLARVALDYGLPGESRGALARAAGAAQGDLAERLGQVLFSPQAVARVTAQPMRPDLWQAGVLQELQALAGREREAWDELIRHAASPPKQREREAWLARGPALVAEVGAQALLARVGPWLLRIPPLPIDGREPMAEASLALARGLAAVCGSTGDAAWAPILEAVASRMAASHLPAREVAQESLASLARLPGMAARAAVLEEALRTGVRRRARKREPAAAAVADPELAALETELAAAFGTRPIEVALQSAPDIHPTKAGLERLRAAMVTLSCDLLLESFPKKVRGRFAADVEVLLVEVENETAPARNHQLWLAARSVGGTALRLSLWFFKGQAHPHRWDRARWLWDASARFELELGPEQTTALADLAGDRHAEALAPWRISLACEVDDGIRALLARALPWRIAQAAHERLKGLPASRREVRLCLGMTQGGRLQGMGLVLVATRAEGAWRFALVEDRVSEQTPRIPQVEWQRPG